MKLKLLLAFLLMAEVRLTLAQTSDEKDNELNEKYWIYRDRFKKRFVNIGGVEDGQSLPFIRIFEGYNTSVLDATKLAQHIHDNQKEKRFT